MREFSKTRCSKCRESPGTRNIKPNGEFIYTKEQKRQRKLPLNYFSTLKIVPRTSMASPSSMI